MTRPCGKIWLAFNGALRCHRFGEGGDSSPSSCAILVFVIIALFSETVCVAQSAANATWHHRHPLPFGSVDMRGVVYGETGGYVAVGELGAVARSVDGISWETGDSGSGQTLNGVAFGEGRYVAVGGAGTILTSVDGLEWVQRSSGTSEELFGAGYGAAGFVAVGNLGVMLISPDGVAWTLVDSGTAQGLKGVTYGIGGYVAVGMAGTVVRSDDGVSWSGQSGVSAVLRGVAFGANQYVAIADQVTVYTSADGMVWEARQTGGTSSDWSTGVAYGDGVFVIVGWRGKTWRSVDGISWSPSTAGESLNAVSYGPGGFVAAGDYGWVGVSDDGINWTPAREETSAIISDVCFGNGLFVAVTTGREILSSTDGVGWARHSSGTTVPILRRVIYGGGKFIAVGDRGGSVNRGLVIASEDGMSWGEAAPGFGSYLNAISHGEGLYVAVGGEGEVWTSAEGTEWIPRVTGSTATLNDVFHGEGIFVAVGSGGEILVSEEGGSWERRSSGTTETLNGVTYARGLWIAVGIENTILISLNTEDWYRRDLGALGGSGFGLNAVEAHAAGWVAVGGSGNVLTSKDGVQWRFENRVTSANLLGLAYGLDTMVAVGANASVFGTILQSGRVDPDTLTVPVIVGHPQGQDSVAGGSVAFRVIATGVTALTYQWRKDGVSIPGANGPELLLTEVQAVDAGYYDVSVSSGDAVSVSASAALRVLSAAESATAWWSGRAPLPMGSPDLFGIDYGESGGYVVVGRYGAIGRSSDGAVWEQVESGTRQTLYQVAYGDGRYVAVGEMGTILTSVDGLEWVQRESSTLELLADVAHGMAGFVAVGAHGVILRSVDGVEWVPVVGPTVESLNGVTYGHAGYVAVGTGGSALRSVDGVTWLPQTVGGGTAHFRDVAYGEGLYVAAGFLELFYTSVDGVEWKPRPSAGWALGVAYANGKFFSVGFSSGMWRSLDGESWQAIASASLIGEGSLHGVCHGAGGFVAVGAGGKVGVSLDGSNWTTAREGIPSIITDVCFGDDRFVAVSAGAEVLTSADGADWVVRSSGTTLPLAGVVWGGGRYVAIGNRTQFGNNAVVVRSDDGVRWEESASGFGSSVYAITYGEGLYVAVGAEGEVWTSAEGTDWTPRVTGTTATLNDVAYADGTFVAVGNAGEILVSQDGIAWDPSASGVTMNLNGVTYANELWVAVGNNSTVLVSVNLFDWVRGLIPGSLRNLRAVAAGNGWFVAGGNFGSLYLSQNSLEWVGQPVRTEADFWGVVLGADSFVGVGSGGVILHSGKMEPGAEFLPAILGSPSSQSVTAGDDLILAVQVGGAGTYSFQWRRNGVNLPGQTTGTLVLRDVQPWDSGNYGVAVSSAAGSVNSQIATVLVTAPALPFADRFGDAGLLESVSGVGSGNNTLASIEENERWHAGREGGHSVWLRWIPASSGVATLRTLGSNFDTLLAVYTGDSVNALTEVVNDEDSGGFLTSAVRFGAVASTEYRIAVDGFAGAVGNVILSWDLKPSASVVPRILRQPEGGSVLAGDSALLQVDAEGPGPLLYQWFLNGTGLPGATAAVLVIDNFQRDNAGVYVVEVSTATGSTLSRPAVLELGTVPQVTSTAKMRELIMGAEPEPLQAMDFSTAGFVSVSAGPIVSQIFNTFGNIKEEGEPNHAGSAGGSSRWFGLLIETAGVLWVDTEGSEIDTVLAVYTLPGQNLLDLRLEASDDNSAADGVRSRVQLPVHPGSYLIAVDGVEGTTGNVQLNWQLGTPARIVVPLTALLAFAGERVALVAEIDGFPPPRIEWRYEGAAIPNADNPELWLDPVDYAHAGHYSIRVENFAGRETSRRIELVVRERVPTMPLPEWGDTGELRFALPDSASWNVVVEVSTDLQKWSPVFTNTPGASAMIWTDEGAAAESVQFYRLSFQP